MPARVIDQYFRLGHPFRVTVPYIQQIFDFSRIGRTTLFSSHSNVAIHDRHNPPRESGNIILFNVSALGFPDTRCVEITERSNAQADSSLAL